MITTTATITINPITNWREITVPPPVALSVLQRIRQLLRQSAVGKARNLHRQRWQKAEQAQLRSQATRCCLTGEAELGGFVPLFAAFAVLKPLPLPSPGWWEGR